MLCAWDKKKGKMMFFVFCYLTKKKLINCVAVSCHVIILISKTMRRLSLIRVIFNLETEFLSSSSFSHRRLRDSQPGYDYKSVYSCKFLMTTCELYYDHTEWIINSIKKILLDLWWKFCVNYLLCDFALCNVDQHVYGFRVD